jgi:hypothetical protein
MYQVQIKTIKNFKDIKYGPTDEAAYWTEDYQETIYKNQVAIFAPGCCSIINHQAACTLFTRADITEKD